MITFMIHCPRTCDMGIRRGRKEASENLSISEEGDCPRCGGETGDSSMPGYLMCMRCNYEWKDPNAEEITRGPPPNFRRDSELIDEFRQDMESGELKDILGIDKDLSSEQEASLGRLQDKWISGMQGHLRKESHLQSPLMMMTIW